MSVISEKFLEVLRSVIPTFIIVVIIHLTVAPLPAMSFVSFIIGTLLVLFGLTIFLIGVDIAIIPIGDYMGKGIARSNKVYVVIIAGLVLGFFISIAEPGLTVLGSQIALVTGGAVSSTVIVSVVSVGLAIMVVIGLLRIVYTFSIVPVLTVSYIVILIFGLFTSSEFLSIAFDASGATTGAITVPFLLALSVGIAALKKDSKSSEEDSFGLVAIASVGAILAVMIYNIALPTEELTGSLDVAIGPEGSLVASYISEMLTQLLEVALTVLPIVFLFLLYQLSVLKLSKRRVRKILIGMVFVYIGLILFMTGVNIGFMDVGSLIGYIIAGEGMFGVLSIVGLVLGVVTILAEPAVSVLTHQIENVSAGAIKRSSVLIALCIGVGAATWLSVIRMIVPGMELWHILLPGYILALGLSYIVPKVFVGIAFDAGGVATGPITATFILAFVQGAAEAIPYASVMVDGFGMISLVALMPILTLQIFGLIYQVKTRKKK